MRSRLGQRRGRARPGGAAARGRPARAPRARRRAPRAPRPGSASRSSPRRATSSSAGDLAQARPEAEVDVERGLPRRASARARSARGRAGRSRPRARAAQRRVERRRRGDGVRPPDGGDEHARARSRRARARRRRGRALPAGEDEQRDGERDRQRRRADAASLSAGESSARRAPLASRAAPRAPAPAGKRLGRAQLVLHRLQSGDRLVLHLRPDVMLRELSPFEELGQPLHGLGARPTARASTRFRYSSGASDGGAGCRARPARARAARTPG